ncbi:tetratricopeptide repeat protein [Pirellulales bacterium]|nr:tetratricopeptide repeat protein [Pirellulales bacterium]
MLSQSPDEMPSSGELPESFVEVARQLDTMASRGVSWSGYERNCAFINHGDGQFINVSGVSGFDFLDDGRALSLVDWDHDGDYDVWVANRTSPRLRMLKNDAGGGGRFLALRLEGQTCNRDAIGARVELVLEQSSNSKMIKTLRAGDGFLGQSSKWLHFGLGELSQIESVRVIWPGGESEEFDNLEADRFYVLVQGNSKPRNWTPPERQGRLLASELQPLKTSSAVQCLLTSRLYIPSLPCEMNDGRRTDVKKLTQGPLLVNLWSANCLPCVAELIEITKRQRDLRSAGLDVVALTVDVLGDGSGDGSGDDADARRIDAAADRLDKIEFPFQHGMATAELVDKLQIAHDHLFLPQLPLPVPSSVLLDESGRIAAFYTGRVSVDQVLEDAGKLSVKGLPLVAEALPFSGTWQGAPGQIWHFVFALQLVDHGYLDDAIDYIAQNRQALDRDPNYPQLEIRISRELKSRGDGEAALSHLAKLASHAPKNADVHYEYGLLLVEQEKFDDAIRIFRVAIAAEPKHARAHNNLGNVLVLRGDAEGAEHHFRAALESDLDLIEAHVNLAPLLAAKGDIAEAVQHLEQALENNPESAVAEFHLAGIVASQGKVDEAVQRYRRAVELQPDFADAHNNLGNLLRVQGANESAIAHFENALKINPKFGPAHGNLAATLMAEGKREEAIAHFRQAAQLSPSDEVPLFNLGMALMMTGKLTEATEQFRQVVDANPSHADGHYRLAVLLEAAQDDASALQHFQAAVELRSDWASPIRRIAWILATSSQQALRDPEQAVVLAERAAELTGRKNPVVLDTLGAAYAAAKRFDEAVASADAALALADVGLPPKIVQQMRSRREMYREQRAFVNPAD